MNRLQKGSISVGMMVVLSACQSTQSLQYPVLKEPKTQANTTIDPNIQWEFETAPDESSHTKNNSKNSKPSQSSGNIFKNDSHSQSSEAQSNQQDVKQTKPNKNDHKSNEDNKKQTQTGNKTQKKPSKKNKKPSKTIAQRILEAQTQAQIQNQQTQPVDNDKYKRINIKDGKKIPAFNRLMKLGVKQLRNNQINQAKSNFIRAQRIAPNSPAVYMYLSEIAIKKGQGTKAESMARRGLLVSQSQRYDKALWNMLYISGKMRKRMDIMQEAKQQLANFK